MADNTPTAPLFAVAILDENELPIDAEAYATYEEAIEEAREGAAMFLEHATHGHFIPTIAVYDLNTQASVWYWCAPTFPVLDTEAQEA